jgi:hypothetical protein
MKGILGEIGEMKYPSQTKGKTCQTEALQIEPHIQEESKRIN